MQCVGMAFDHSQTVEISISATRKSLRPIFVDRLSGSPDIFK
jgi:hypothetical protein